MKQKHGQLNLKVIRHCTGTLIVYILPCSKGTHIYSAYSKLHSHKTKIDMAPYKFAFHELRYVPCIVDHSLVFITLPNRTG